MSTAETKMRDAICALGAKLAARGFCPGTSGNISARVADGWLMTPTNSSLGELDPGFGVELMILAAPEIEVWTGTQDTLPESGILATSLAEDGTIDLADRLALRLGEENVVRLLPRDSHLPERVQTAAGVSVKPAPAGAWRRVADLKGARPTRLLQRPEPIEVTAFVPDDPPMTFQWRRHAHRIVRAEGPERLADEWWRPRSDGSRPPSGSACCSMKASRWR